ncbi:MAG: B12-binding domain-containing protein [Candidatus Hodarchaeota archaeon]
MSTEDLINEFKNSIKNLDREEALKLSKRAISRKMDILEILERGFGEGIKIVGDLWENGDFFLPELMMGGKILEECMDILIPHLQSGETRKVLGKVVIATIEGDIHSIGKTIVGTMLKAYGFEVYDLGVDVRPEVIIQEAIKKDVDIIAVSALLTTTMVKQKRVVELLKDKKIRDKFKVILGGAPVTERWVEECGADGYAENAIIAVKVVKTLIKN